MEALAPSRAEILRSHLALIHYKNIRGRCNFRMALRGISISQLRKGLQQGWANYGLRATYGPLGCLIRPVEYLKYCLKDCILWRGGRGSARSVAGERGRSRVVSGRADRVGRERLGAHARAVETEKTLGCKLYSVERVLLHL